MVLEKKIFKDSAIFDSFSLPVWKLFGIPEPYEQILNRTTQGTFLQRISPLDVVVSKKKMFIKKNWCGGVHVHVQQAMT
jgi:hypothetical protein